MGLIPRIRRAVRPAARTAQAAVRWRRLSFDDAPPMFGNAKPKSGSHLLLQLLSGFTRIVPYAYVAADPIRTITREGRRRRTDEIRAELEGVPRGVVGWGYVEPTPELVAFLCQPGRINYFIYRDPRDVIVSQVYFATDMYEEHGMHAYYESLPDFAARLKVAITGIDRDGLRMVSVRQRYEDVFRWLEQEGVLCLRYEDLVNHRDMALNVMLDEVEKRGYQIPIRRPAALEILVAAIRPHKSRTFRSGTPGGWREHFTDEHKNLFNTVAGDLLVRLGYESTNNW